MTKRTSRNEPLREIGRRPGQLPGPAKPVRVTVDFPTGQYRELTEWASAAAAELGVPRVTLAEAIRAMVEVANADPSVSAAVATQIRQVREQHSG